MSKATSLVSMNKAICGGEPCVSGTRIPLRLLFRFRKKGFSDEQIIEQFPILSAEQLAAIWELSA